MKQWHIYRGTGTPHNGIERLPHPPHWRAFKGEVLQERQLDPDPQLERRFGGAGDKRSAFQASPKVVDMVNAALYLRRPLLVTGKPGVGKSTLAHAVAYELKLGPVLAWPITSRSLLQDVLYRYDAIGRFQQANLSKDRNDQLAADIGRYIRLGPVGTALLPSTRPRVLLIDEIDKSDIDLPNDLLNIFEEGEFEIPELARLADELANIQVYPHDGQEMVTIHRGRILCRAFPFVVITSNGERELPAPFLRRCLRLPIELPTENELAEIVAAHFGPADKAEAEQRSKLLEEFLAKRDIGGGHLATDQLLNAIYLVGGKNNVDLESLADDIWKKL